MGVPTDYAFTPADNALVRARVEVARREMAALARSFEERQLRVQTVVIEHPFPAPVILDYAERNAVDLIALTTHGHGGAVRLALGSIADKVVRGAQVPVLLYRPPAQT
jgi:nucleotide-binding universal stress UspA family protein